MKIFKYELPVLEKFELYLPIGAQILRVDSIDGKFWLWAIVDEQSTIDNEPRHIEMYKTGQPIDEPASELRYIGLCRLYIMQELGLYVFERVKP